MIHDHELIIDSFAGGGGASLGITWATGRCPDIAINHDREALAMHAENHARTKHSRDCVAALFLLFAPHLLRLPIDGLQADAAERVRRAVRIASAIGPVSRESVMNSHEREINEAD